MTDIKELPAIDKFVKNVDDVKGYSQVIAHRHGGVVVEQEDGVASDFILMRRSECSVVISQEVFKVLDIVKDIDYENMGNLELAVELVTKGALK